MTVITESFRVPSANDIIIPDKLHYGCGDVRLDGFYNYDARMTNATDSSGSLEELLDRHQGFFKQIYLCHVLEHFPLTTIAQTLSKFRSLLHPADGVLYISVPDFQKLAAMYLSGIVNLSHIVRAIHGGQEYHENTHYISFDRQLLSQLLQQAGFTHVKPFSPSDILPLGITDTSTYRINSKMISLNMMAFV